jgi:hypothetical protein
MLSIRVFGFHYALFNTGLLYVPKIIVGKYILCSLSTYRVFKNYILHNSIWFKLQYSPSVSKYHLAFLSNRGAIRINDKLCISYV